MLCLFLFAVAFLHFPIAGLLFPVTLRFFLFVRGYAAGITGRLEGLLRWSLRRGAAAGGNSDDGQAERKSQNRGP